MATSVASDPSSCFEGIHGVRVVGRLGGHAMNEGDIAPQDQGHDDHPDFHSETTNSQVTDGEFEHDTADYQWLLDYEYRESYSRESLGAGRDGRGRVSVLDQDHPDLSYETLARTLDANLAEIDMDDFRSEDIHQLLTLPMCDDYQEDGEAHLYASMDEKYPTEEDTEIEYNNSSQCHHHSCHHHSHHPTKHKDSSPQDQDCIESSTNPNVMDDPPLLAEEEEEEEEEYLEEYSGVSGELSLYQSGPLFSPLKEPPHLPPTSFSVDSLDTDSLHEDLILTCQANKDNYTIAFEGSYIQFSEDSDYHEAESDTTGSGTWSTERLEGRSPAPNMTHSDQPYTTWSRVSRRSSRTPEHHRHSGSHQAVCRPEVASPAPLQRQHHHSPSPQPSSRQQHGAKSNSMPNLMRRSLMRRSLEAAGQCVKVYDLQNSLRSSQLCNTKSSDGSNFSLVKLFMKQKSLSKEAVSLSSSYTDHSQEGASSSSDNQSSGHNSSDWIMHSQSDMDGSASPIPHLTISRNYRGKISSRAPEITPRTMNPHNHADYPPTMGDRCTTISPTHLTLGINDGTLLNNNNNNIPLVPLLDNGTPQHTNIMDNVTSFEDSLKESMPCSKPPVTSPIREEPEGMDISVDSRGENKVQLDMSEKEGRPHDPLRLKDTKSAEHNNMNSSKNSSKEVSNKNNQKNSFNILNEDKQRSQSPGTPKRHGNKKEVLGIQRRRQDSGNSSSGYVSNKGSTEKIRRPSDSDQVNYASQKPKPRPRVLKQYLDQCLQTSANLKVSATVNTSGYLDKKEVYVYYPNYALPDLTFLKEKKYNVDAKVFLVPQHYTTCPNEIKKIRDCRSRRPFSCGDMEKLRKQGFSHVRDWDSLNFLLPKELKEMLADETECMETIKPSFCQSVKSNKKVSGNDPRQNEMKISDSSNSTQPSSGFRGSSTLLNESEAEAASVDRVAYKYDATSTDSDVFEKPPPLPKRSISLSAEEQFLEDGESPPPRPPLPRGILRKSTSLKDDPQKASGNKRHSTIDQARNTMREELLKRRSLQEPMEHIVHKAIRETIPEQCSSCEDSDRTISCSPPSPMGCSCLNQCTGFCGKGLLKKNLLRVSELPDVSSHEELTEEDFVRLRSQVSNFLVTKGTRLSTQATESANVCQLCPKKSVSFAEKVCVHQRNTPECLGTPPNSPDLSLLKKAGSPSCATVIVPAPPTNEQQKVVTTSMEEESRPMLYDAQEKKTLVLSVRSAVEKLVAHFSAATTEQQRVTLGTSGVTPAVCQIALNKLCPAVYALLSDGLQPSLHSLFGKISNSVWRVIEATSQMGPSTKALNDLVLTLNSEECLSEGPIKFNAFIFGLLNIRSLDSWLNYLRTRESVIQKHYHPEAFLYLANTATRGLFDDLLLALQPLSILSFNLDILHEYKQLHASLLKMEERLILHTSSTSPGERPPSVLDHLLATKESKEFKNTAAQQDRVKALMKVLTSPEIEDAELIRSISEFAQDRCRSPRPRSCYENTGFEDLQSTLKKRWSGVQLGSKLITAIDKLMLEETTPSGSSGDYTDSLDTPKSVRRMRKNSICSDDDGATDLKVSDISSKDGDISERSATDKDTENEKGLLKLCLDESEGDRFRRLQLKWEQMAGNEGRPKSASGSTGSITPDKTISPSSTRSRIPRPVSMTSPQKPFKPFDPTKEKISPGLKSTGHKPFNSNPVISTKDHPKPAPRRSLRDRNSQSADPHHQDECHQSSTSSKRNPSVRSRLGPHQTTGVSNVTGAHGSLSSVAAARASSVPSRAGSERNLTNQRYETQKRVGNGLPRSSSHGRRINPGDMPRLKKPDLQLKSRIKTKKSTHIKAPQLVLPRSPCYGSSSKQACKVMQLYTIMRIH